jgi:hypothetical protein
VAADHRHWRRKKSNRGSTSPKYMWAARAVSTSHSQTCTRSEDESVCRTKIEGSADLQLRAHGSPNRRAPRSSAAIPCPKTRAHAATHFPHIGEAASPLACGAGRPSESRFPAPLQPASSPRPICLQQHGPERSNGPAWKTSPWAGLRVFTWIAGHQSPEYAWTRGCVSWAGRRQAAEHEKTLRAC